MSTLKYAALGTYSTAIDGSASSPTLKNLANNGQKIGNAIDLSGSSDRNIMVGWELFVRGASAFSSGGYAELYLIKTLDGTNYEDGDDSVAPPLIALLYAFPLRAVSTQQRIVSVPLVVPAGKFKPLIINKGGQAFTNTNGENILSYAVVDESIV